MYSVCVHALLSCYYSCMMFGMRKKSCLKCNSLVFPAMNGMIWKVCGSKRQWTGADLRCHEIVRDCKATLCCLWEEHNSISNTQIHLFAGATSAWTTSSKCAKICPFLFFHHGVVFTLPHSQTHTTQAQTQQLKPSHASQFRDCLDLAYFMD